METKEILTLLHQYFLKRQDMESPNLYGEDEQTLIDLIEANKSSFEAFFKVKQIAELEQQKLSAQAVIADVDSKIEELNKPVK